MKTKLFFIVFFMTVLSPLIQADTPIEIQSANNKELKILSWNIYMLPYLSLFNGNGERAKTIADKLQNSDYQIIVFQEAFSSKCRHILAKRLAKKYPFQYGPTNKSLFSVRTNSGLWVISKIPLTELGKIRFSASKGFDIIARKGAVLFQGCFQGSNFQLLATHLQADNSHEIRSKQCAEIKEHLLNTYFKKNTPQFICGDFNIDMDDTPSYQAMLRTLDAENGELSGTVKATYDEVNNNLARVTHGKLRIIDYVLVRNAKLVDKIERKVQTFYAQVGGMETNLSDHYAMEFRVDFNNIMNEPETLQLALGDK